MSDITNYAYIWYKEDPTKLLEFTPGEQDLILKIILDYSFPCYLANESIRDIPEADRKELLENELLFIRKKIKEAHLDDVVIIQIPRVLYDLFNLLFSNTYNLNLCFSYDIDIEINSKGIISYSKPNYTTKNRVEYNKFTAILTNKVKNNILELNNFIINFIRPYLSNIITEYNVILESILCSIDMSFQVNVKDILGRIISLKKPHKKIIRQIIDFEKEPTKGYTILYRGAEIDMDSTICEPEIRSLSYNNSILSGFLNDDTACTLTIMEERSDHVNKIKFTIKKFNIFDNTNENSLLFIPPIHPFLQLYCRSELFHPRTKIGYDYLVKLREFDPKYEDSVKGILASTKSILEADYLISDKTVIELETLYQQYKSSGQISVWQKKYLKYKNKYLELKKYLLNKKVN